MQPVVHLRAAVALLGRFPALAGVDLDVEPGEIVLLRGPNGAGKTTLLRLCAGLIAPARGQVEVLGVDLSIDRRAVRPLVGLMGHTTGLYDDLTVTENVQFWARAAGIDTADADAALDRVELPQRVRSLTVERLSAGQRRRTSLAAMLVRRPRLWLLDEPHAGLDASARDLVDGLITEASGLGATVLFASHELDRAEAVATRRVTIDGGCVVSDSAPPSSAPASSEAADHVS